MKVKKIIYLIFIIIFCMVLIIGCKPSGGNVNPPPPSNPPSSDTPPDYRTERKYSFLIRDRFFVITEGVEFYFNDKKINAEYSEGEYIINSKENYTDFILKKQNTVFHFAAVLNETLNEAKILYVTAAADSGFEFGEPFSFHGKFVENYDGETRLKGAKIMVGDIVVLIAENGDFAIDFLYEEITFDFFIEGYILLPSFKTIDSSLEGFTVKGNKIP